LKFSKKLYLVKWVDIVQNPAWLDGDQADEDAVCWSIGRIVRRHPKKITFTHTWQKSGAGDRLDIPKGCILSLEEIGTWNGL
tara:strand:+ start:289 stop:534 length:246 start_codon:yes stop_codon:yes gene_type:complete